MNCKCFACEKEFPYFSAESPMLKDSLWLQIASENPEGYLCSHCMEKRLGRPITVDDLMRFEDGRHVPFNSYYLRKFFPEELKKDDVKPWLELK